MRSLRKKAEQAAASTATLRQMASISSRIAYVVLSAIEDEFRSIVEQFAGDEAPDSLLTADLLQSALARRRRDGLTITPHFASQLLPYLDFQDSYQLGNTINDRLPNELAAGLRERANDVSKAVSVRNRVAHNRPLDIDDLPTVVDLAKALSKISGWPWSKISETLSEIKDDPGYIFRVSANLIVDPDNAVPNNLPVPDFDETSLLGRKAERQSLTRAIRGAWPVISILGDGGIGKTALALQVCYDLIEQSDCPFEAIVWVSAKNAQLTSNEIVRIESAVEDSLGLFAAAAAEFGSTSGANDAIDDLLGVLGSFPTLLVLDNVETVIDESFPRFLREIPQGSKVLITSRIGVKTESPFNLSGLTDTDAVALMRILGRSRNFDLSSIAEPEDLSNWAKRMNHHPLYIKWFISGLQSGQMPENLLNDNGLVLDFCMSNVFEYLSPDSRLVLRSMLVVSGAHTVAELAFLTELDSSSIQKAVLDLTTTNFVSQVRSGTSGTALELSEFARQYLRRTLTIDGTERRTLAEKQRQLYALGGGLKDAHALQPYVAHTIDVRGVGDYSVAKLLREALDFAAEQDIDEALKLCAEATELAPGYHEAARIEAHIHELSANFGEAYESYSRAKDLAPEDSYVAYFFGQFMVESGFDSTFGIRELQRAAQLDPDAPTIHFAIANAFAKTGDLRQAMDAALYAVTTSKARLDDKRHGTYLLWVYCAPHIQSLVSQDNWPQIAEDVEFAMMIDDAITNDSYEAATLDLMLWVQDIIAHGANTSSDNFIAKRLAALAARLRADRLSIDSAHSDRLLGTVKNLNEDRGFGFLKIDESEYFFHASELWDRAKFEELSVGSLLAFTPAPATKSGRPQALSIHWVA